MHICAFYIIQVWYNSIGFWLNPSDFSHVGSDSSQSYPMSLCTPRLISLVLVQYYKVLNIGPNPIRAQCGPVSDSGMGCMWVSRPGAPHGSNRVNISGQDSGSGRAGRWVYSEPETDDGHIIYRLFSWTQLLLIEWVFIAFILYVWFCYGII